MATLTPAQLEQLEAAELANVIRKLNDHKSLTRRESEVLARQRQQQPEKQPEYVQTWDELAGYLGRTRRTLQKWRDRFGKKCPKDKGDRKSVPAWRKFMAAHNLADEPEEPEGDGEPNKSHWDRERSRIEFQTAQFRLEIERKKYVQLNEICSAVGQMLAGFRTALNMLPGSAARWLIGLKDFHLIKERLQNEVDGVLQSLGRCKYLEDLAAQTVAAKFPQESAEQQQKIASCVEQVFIEIGREALQDLLQREFVECPPLG